MVRREIEADASAVISILADDREKLTVSSSVRESRSSNERRHSWRRNSLVSIRQMQNSQPRRT